MRKSPTQWLYVYLIAVISCGGSGDSASPSPASESPTTEEPVVQDPVDLFGKFSTSGFYSGDTRVILRLHDESAFTIKDFATDEDGKATIRIDEFRGGDTFSLELLTFDKRRIGFLDFDPDASGVQSDFTYSDGGSGLDLGSIEIPSDDFGAITFNSEQISGSLGGGFSLVDDSSGETGITEPTGMKSLDVQSWIGEAEPAEILYGFYQYSEYPAAYLDAYRKHAGAKIAVRALSDDSLLQVQVADGPKWIETATRFDSLHQAWSPWARRSFEVPLVSGYSGGVELKTGGKDLESSVLVFDIQWEKHGRTTLDRILPYEIGFPPKVTALTINNADPWTIDYSRTGGENGLTRPFSWSAGDIMLQFDLPRKRDYSVLKTSEIDNVVIRFKYFKRSDSGDHTQLSFDRRHYTGIFGRPRAVGTTDYVSRRWDPDDSTMTYSLSNQHLAAADSVNLLVDEPVLLFNEETVDWAEMHVTFAGEFGSAQTLVSIAR
jgi:hypothetical protein